MVIYVAIDTDTLTAYAHDENDCRAIEYGSLDFLVEEIVKDFEED